MDSVYASCAKLAISAELQDGLQPFVYWHVAESIQEGHDPEQVGELQEEIEVEALVLERRSQARDRALGYYISLLHWYTSQQSGADRLEPALTALESDLKQHASHTSFDDFHLDTTDIYEYVERQKQNAGLIADDFAWHRQPKTSEKSQWTSLFKKALELTRTAYVEACKRFEHRFNLGSQADLALVQLLDYESLIDLVSKSRAKPIHTPAPLHPTPATSASTSSFWSQRIGNTRTTAGALLPKFDPAHLVQAGEHFRAACIEHVRSQQASGSSSTVLVKDLDVVLSQALNPETNPDRLFQRAQQLYTSASASDEEAVLRSSKDLLSSALRILGIRDGERNTSLHIEAHNLRGYINLRLADLRPQHEANYLSRAVADWSASTELDLDQNEIFDVLAQTEVRLEALPTAIKAGPEQEASSTDSTMSRQSIVSEASTIPAASASAQSEGTPTAKDQDKKIAALETSTNDSKRNAKNGTKHGPKNASKESTKNSSKQGSKNGSKKSSDKVEDEKVDEAQPKPREKTILESPFFRSDLVTGLMVDSLLALPFPHRALRETLRIPSAAALAAASQDHVSMLDRHAKAHQQITKALTAENKAQLKVAVKSVSAVLALPELQQTRDDPPHKVLRRTSLRLVLGTLHVLLNELVKAQTELDLVSNALKPDTRKVGGQRRKEKPNEPANQLAQTGPAADTTRAAETTSGAKEQLTDEAVWAMQTRVQGETLWLLAKACWMANKVQEAVKFFRWFVRWYSEQQAQLAIEAAEAAEGQGAVGPGDAEHAGVAAVDMELAQLDMGWWDKVVVVAK